MSAQPGVPKRWPDQYVDIKEAPMPSTNVVASPRKDRVLYDVKGGELLRIEDRPMLGFHRENGRPS